MEQRTPRAASSKAHAVSESQTWIGNIMTHRFRNSLIILTLLVVAATSGHSADIRKPNIILILADDLGYGEAACYGGPVKTPHMDHMAGAGVRCTDAYAAFPVCSPSRAAILTGRYLQRFGPTYEDYFGHDAPELDPVKHVTIGQLLKEAGYRTACFGKWNVSNRNRTPANAFGFDRWVGLHLNHDYYTHKLVANNEHDLFKDGKPFDRKGIWSDTIFADKAIEFIKDGSEKPFFIFLPFQAPHDPIQDPDKPFAERLSSQDPANRPTLVKMIERLDTEIGRVVQALDEEKISDSTLVILTSDNGGAKFLGRNLPLRGEKQWLQEGGIRVPLILRWPVVLPEGKTFTSPVAAMDITATIAAAAGAQARSGKPFDGIDLIPALSGKTQLDPNRPIFFRRRNIDVPKSRNEIRESAVRQGDWKLLRTYHLKDDIGEINDLATTLPDRTNTLEELLNDWEKEMGKTAVPFESVKP
jgi:arylsulfatase A-like enzyme